MNFGALPREQSCDTAICRSLRRLTQKRRSRWICSAVTVASLTQTSKVGGFIHTGAKALTVMPQGRPSRSEEHTSELQSLMRISYAVFCLNNKKNNYKHQLRKKNK